MEADEALGNGANISYLPYANVNHADWNSEFPDCKAPFQQQASENRAAPRKKKTQQVEHSSTEGLRDREEEQTERYVKDMGFAQIHGQIFEYKFCALVFLRAKNKQYNFKLASNVKEYGKFDDVFVEYLDDNSRKSHIFVQLKSKLRRRVTMEELLAEKGGFSLRKYYKSYIKIEEKFSCTEEGVKLEGSIDRSLFIIYTNADVEKNLRSKKVTDIGEAEFLMTGGTVLQFNEEDHPDIYKHLQDLPKYRQFFSRFRIFYSQTDEKEMDSHIKYELQQIMNLPDSELGIAYMSFRDIMKEWWQHKNFFLKDTNSRENDPLQKTSEKIKPFLVAKMDQRKSEIDELSIKYEESAIKYIKQLTETQRAVLIFAPGNATTLTAAKIHQMLSDTEHIILKLQQLIRCKTEVILAWKSMFDVLVLESDSSAEVSPDLFNELSGVVNGNDQKKFIFISKKVGNMQQIHELRNIFHGNLAEGYDSCKFTDMVTESRMLFLNKNVSFQGREVKLNTIVKNDDIHLLNELDCESISLLLLENEKPSIGKCTEDTVKYYIDRTLRCRKQANNRFTSQSEIQPASSADISQGVRDSSPHLGENLGNATAKYWKPSTLLKGDGRIILVTDEPGMGKSTLLDHLAQQSREPLPDLWIVRVSINKYTKILNELQTKGCDEIGVIELLTEAAQIKKTGGVFLEERLFNYTYNSTGNMAVLIDGVDEVSPRYTEEVIQVLKMLSKTKIKVIWVTSRNSVRDRLETEFQCQSYSLVPFSEEDQKRFLVKFWKQKSPGLETDYLENFANRVVKLSNEHLTVEDKTFKKFIGIPLQSWLLAEMFEENVKECSTSTTVELPEHINIVMLYDLYVEKKWDIYLSHKKGCDRINVRVLELHKTFIHNHMAAALVAILSTQQLEKLTDKTIADVARVFLQKFIEDVEELGIIIEVIEGRPVFQHRTLAEYLAARWLCDNFQHGQTFMKDHLLESGFLVVRSMVDRILADKNPLHEAVLNSSLNQVEKLLQKRKSITEKDRGGRTPLHLAISCRSPKIIKLLLEHKADVSCVDTLLGFSPVEYAIRMDDWEMLSLLMEKRPDIRKQVLSRTNRDCTENIPCALRAAAQYGHNELLKFLISEGGSVNVALPEDNSTLLHVAARSQQTETVKLLVRLEASIDSHDESGKTPLHVSVETGNFEVIKCLVEQQETVLKEAALQHVVNPEITVNRRNTLNVRDINGNTPLHLGVAGGNTNIVSYLVRAGSDLNICNVQEDYPLTLAARYGKNDIVKLLMEGEFQCEEAQIGALRSAIVGGLVDTTSLLLMLEVPVNIGENEKPIHVASRLGLEEIVRLLLQHGASLTSRTDAGNTALHLASEAGHLNLVKYLAEVDRDGMCSLNYENETPLHLAARNGRDCIVTYLTEIGCNIKTPSANGATCLHVACENGHYTTVECLLQHGAEVNAKNSAHQTPLRIAARRGKTKIVELLFLHNANFSLQDKHGITALLAASMNGYHDTAEFIMQRIGSSGKASTDIVAAARFGFLDLLQRFVAIGEDINVKADNGESPLHAACESGHVATLEYLCEQGAKLDWHDNNGNTAIHVAVSNGHLDATMILVEKGANLCAADASGSTALHIAAKDGYLNIVQYLAHSFAPIDKRNAKNETALLVAAAEGHEKIVSVLIEQGAGIGVRDREGKTAFDIAIGKGYTDITQLLKDRAEGRKLVSFISRTELNTISESGNVELLKRKMNTGDSADSATDRNDTESARMFKTTAEDILEFQSNPRNALHTVAVSGNLEEVERLVEAGIALDYGDPFGRTALWIAAERGHKLIIRCLLQNGSCVNIPDSEGLMPTDIAVREGHWGAVNEFLEHYPEIRQESTEILTNQLYEASQFGDLETVGIILKCGISINTRNNYGNTPLHVAAKFGHKEVVRFLIKCGAYVHTADNDGKTPLLLAAENGHFEIVRLILCATAVTDISTPTLPSATKGHTDLLQQLVNHNANVNTADKDGFTPLYAAGQNGHVDVVRELLNYGANVNSANKDGYTPLYIASQKGHFEVVRDLLKHGGNVNTANNDGSLPLFAAGLNGHVEVVLELLGHGASVNTANKEYFKTLHAAAMSGHVEVVRVLLNHGAKVNSANKECSTPLHVAALNGHVVVVRELLIHGAKLKTKNKEGFKPLHAAALSGHVEVVRELLNHGAKVNSANKADFTPLHAAVRYGHVEVVRELLNRGAKVNIENKDGFNPLHVAALNNHVEVVQELLKHCANVYTANKCGFTPLYAAALEGHVDVVRVLLNYGAYVNTANKEYWSPLFAAGQNGHVEVVRELLMHGANVNSANKYGFTLLHVACKNGHLEVVRELLNHDANVNTADKDGSTPLHAAGQNGHVQVVRELLNHGANVNTANKKCFTPLYAAGMNGHIEVVQDLLNHGAQVDKSKEAGRKFINLAAEKGYVDSIRDVLK